MSTSMKRSRWSYQLVLLAAVLCCMAFIIPASAGSGDPTHVVLNITPDIVCAEDHQINITFHANSGMSAGVNGFLIGFYEEDIDVEDLDPQCITIYNNGQSGSPSEIIVFETPDPEYTQYNFPDGLTVIKLWTPIPITFNTDVTIIIDCAEIECPCNCSGYFAWVARDGGCAVMSSPDYLNVEIDVHSGPNGTVELEPDGPEAPPDFTATFPCCDDATFEIEADPCYYISSVIVTPLCGEEEDEEECEFVPPDPDDYFGESEYTYTFTNLTCCYALDAEFAARQCNITAVACMGGRIQSPDGTWSPPDYTESFYCGDTPTYFIKPDLSNKISNVTVDGESVYDDLIFFDNGSATYTFDPLVCDGQDIVIRACFELAPVDAFLKYQNATRDCRGVTEVQVYGADDIQSVLDYVDQVYLSGNSSSFDINGTSTGTHFGSYSAGAYADDATSGVGDTLTINVLSLPTTNPETYKVTYDDGTTIRYATLTILLDGTPVWAPAPPFGVRDVIDVQAQIPAWNMVTQAYLDANPDFEGLIGAVIYVDDGEYNEVIEVDTPGLHLVNMTGAFPEIDAEGLTPAGSGDTMSAVFLSAGCTGIQGFEIESAGEDVGVNASGIAVYPSSEKCQGAFIWDYDPISEQNIQVPCHYGRVNILDNEIHENTARGIRAINCSVLISGNVIHENAFDGIAGEDLFTGVECIDPFAYTHSPASSEIIFNDIFDNGPSGRGVWVVWDPVSQTNRFTSNATACGTLPGWTDSGIEIDEMSEPGLVPDQVLYIKHNWVHDNYHAGIFLMEYSTDEVLNNTILIEANEIADNGVFGISTFAGEPSQVTVIYNDIEGNGFWGIKNWETEDEDDVLIAKENYWGEPGGPHWGPEPITAPLIPPCYCHEPDQRSDALGNGDNVSHWVEYNPWLYIPAEDIFHDGSNPQWMMRALGSDSLLLQKGWNTLSVPCTLYTGADTVAEISGLGDYITNSNTVVVYSWNATSGLWVDVGAMNLPITPGQGYYIKMKYPSKFPVLYSDNPSPGLPTFPVVQGWNLIGAPWGIDRVDDGYGDEGRWAVASPDLGDPEAFMMVWQSLESIKEGNGGTKGVAIVISPSVPGQYAIWSESVTSGFWQITNNREMATGEGYWVYMVNPSTYAGFEITPFFYT